MNRASVVTDMNMYSGTCETVLGVVVPCSVEMLGLCEAILNEVGEVHSSWPDDLEPNKRWVHASIPLGKTKALEEYEKQRIATRPA